MRQILLGDRVRIKGELFILGFNPRTVSCFEDYELLVGRRRVMTSALGRELVSDKLAEVMVKHRNLIVNAGKTQLVNLVTLASQAPFAYVEPGSGSTAPLVTDTVLTTPITPAVAVTSAYLAVSPNVAEWDTFFGTAANNGTWNEAGLFVTSTPGTMGSHALLGTPFTKSTGNTAVMAWKWTF